MFDFFFQWLKLSSSDVEEQIVKLARKGLMPSQIGEYYNKIWKTNMSCLFQEFACHNVCVYCS